MLRQAAIVATVAVTCLIWASFSNQSTEVVAALFIVSAAAIGVPLFLGYSLLARIELGPSIRIRRLLLSHIVLHIVPASYLVMQYLMGSSLLINTIYLLPVVLFFYTGRRTWGAMFEQFGTKLYRIYYLGNTALMRLGPILVALGYLVDESIGTDGFRRAIVGYFSIHLWVTGLTMIWLEKDIRAMGASAKT